VPAEIVKYASDNLAANPVALIGCRVSRTSEECCEFDLAVFTDERRENQFLRVGSHTVELIYLAGEPKDHIVDTYGMTIMNDSKFALASAAKDVAPEKHLKALAATGKKLLVESLMYQQEMNGVLQHPVLAAMWAKLAAFRFVAGTLALSGERPMPLHELEQVRAIDSQVNSAADGIQAALECIGIERATRPAISRSFEAVSALKSNDYDRDLAVSKADYLLERQKLADCYYYLGRIASENLAKRRKGSFHTRYSKLIQIALDLTSDVQQLQKLQRQIFKAAGAGLRG
jgi:hypothetical protein